MAAWKRNPTSVAVIVIAIGAICALLLALPGQTITTRYLNDLFIFLDGIHRVSLGQVPNRDFHTALGPLVYYAPAVGYWLSGNFGSAMPVGVALLVMALALPASHICSSRLRPAVALPLGLFLILIAAVPINLGESISALSFAMFYNRIGWAALGFLLVMYLQPAHPRPHQPILDAGCAAFLIVLMLYIKISYGIVGLGFLIFLLLDRRQRVWSLTAIGLVIASCIGIEILWGGSSAHFADLLLAGEVSGSMKPIYELAQILFKNLADFILFAIFLALTLWRTRSIRDFLFFGFCAGSGFLLITQNFQSWGIVTLAAGAAVAVERLARMDRVLAAPWRRSMTSGAQLLLLAFLLPATVHHAAALGLHAGLASLKKGDPIPLPHFEEVRLAQLWNVEDYQVFTRYLSSLDDGSRALSGLSDNASNVLVLDFVGPFSAGLGLTPPYGDSTWHHWGRTVNEHYFLPAKALFRDVQIVMEPKWPVEASTAGGLKQIYSEYLDERYELSQETADWRIYTLRNPPAETVSRSYGSDPDETQEGKT